MLKTNLVVETVGSPDITMLSDSEQRIFLETLYSRIVEARKQSLSQKELET